MTNRYKNKTKIENKEIRKPYNKNILDIYEILELSGFDNYPKIINYDDREIKYEYIESKKIHEHIENEELIKTLSELHSKTSKYIEVSKNKYNNIKNIIENNLNYLTKYYNEMIDNIENEVYMSPSNYLIARNFSSILIMIDTSRKYLSKWYKKVENKNTERVSVIHNNLSLDHFIISNKNYLISFDGARVDTPILDLYKFYKKECLNINFKLLYQVYNNHFTLLEEEDLLLKTMLCIPPKIEKIHNEFKDTININESFKYINKTLEFINQK